MERVEIATGAGTPFPIDGVEYWLIQPNFQVFGEAKNHLLMLRRRQIVATINDLIDQGLLSGEEARREKHKAVSEAIALTRLPLVPYEFNKTELKQVLDEQGNPKLDDDGKPVREFVKVRDEKGVPVLVTEMVEASDVWLQEPDGIIFLLSRILFKDGKPVGLEEAERIARQIDPVEYTLIESHVHAIAREALMGNVSSPLAQSEAGNQEPQKAQTSN